ncbi:aminodeoxychorismate lyase [Candidatus Magnetominusculus dajiuhuensis]|uniref:aminodeoxychorismate lyase n=1 Tax=Candidatus Magnetominusculus dajiuhuensis TaxID=3137712 RepID=UPI003B4391AA
MKIYLNGEFVSESDAKVSVFDRGFLYGDGVFETMRAYGGVVFRINEHIKRLRRSLGMIRLDLSLPESSLYEAIYDTLSANDLTEAVVRLSVSRGTGPIGLSMSLCGQPTLVIIAKPFTPYPQDYYDNGIRVVTTKIMRTPPDALNPMIKSLNFLNNIMAKAMADDAGAHEALMLSANGHLAECSVSNIFFVKEDILYTPSVKSGILDGVMRAQVLELACETGLGVVEGEFFPATLYRAHEVFVTNSTMEIMPVTTVDAVSYPVGHVTRRLMKAFFRYREQYVKYRQ